MSKKKSIWYIISIIIIIVLFIVLLFSHCGNKQQNDDKIQDDTEAVEWNGKQSLPTGNNGIVNAIEIPGFNLMGKKSPASIGGGMNCPSAVG